MITKFIYGETDVALWSTQRVESMEMTDKALLPEIYSKEKVSILELTLWPYQVSTELGEMTQKPAQDISSSLSSSSSTYSSK